MCRFNSGVISSQFWPPRDPNYALVITSSSSATHLCRSISGTGVSSAFHFIQSLTSLQLLSTQARRSFSLWYFLRPIPIHGGTRQDIRYDHLLVPMFNYNFMRLYSVYNIYDGVWSHDSYSLGPCSRYLLSRRHKEQGVLMDIFGRFYSRKSTVRP